MARRASSIDQEIDTLFQLPPGEFTPARNALAARLRKEGQKDESERVRALVKPPISAWAVNQLYWRHRKELDDLLDVGERFRKAQAAQLAGKTADLRGLLEARREALSRLAHLAAPILREAGHNPTPATMRRITTTLEALATYGSVPEAPQAGRLTDDIDPPGFEALAALVPNVAGGHRTGEPSRVLTFQKPAREERARKRKAVDPEEEARRLEEERRARQAEAREALRAAEQTLRDARGEAERLEAELKKVAARAKAATQEKETLEKQFEKVAEEAEDANREAHRVAREAADAAQAVSDAEAEVERAKAKVEQFS